MSVLLSINICSPDIYSADKPRNKSRQGDNRDDRVNRGPPRDRDLPPRRRENRDNRPDNRDNQGGFGGGFGGQTSPDYRGDRPDSGRGRFSRGGGRGGRGGRGRGGFDRFGKREFDRHSGSDKTYVFTFDLETVHTIIIVNYI